MLKYYWQARQKYLYSINTGIDASGILAEPAHWSSYESCRSKRGALTAFKELKGHVNSTCRRCQSKKVAGRAGPCHLLPAFRLPHNRR